MTLPRLHLVTDDAVLAAPDFGDRATAVLRAHGPRVALHVRGHGHGGGALLQMTDALAAVGTQSGATVLVNDRVDVAILAGVGVQLGRRSLPIPVARRLLGDVAMGYSAHGAQEAADAGAAGADFVMLGTIYATPSHPGAAGAGPDRIRSVRGRLELPLVAIGGIVPERVAEVMAAGAYGVAVLSGVWATADAVAAAGRYLDELERAGESEGWES